MVYKYTGRKGGSKPSKKKFGFEITGVKTKGLSEKSKALVVLAEEVQDVMRHPERVCICRQTGKQWEGCAGMEKGDPCPKMSLKLRELEQKVNETKNLPDEPVKEGPKPSTCCGAGLSAVDMTPCSAPAYEPKVQHPIAASTIDYMAALKQHQATTKQQ